MKSLAFTLLTTVALTTALTAATSQSALAGGPGQVYVYGDTKSECEANLSASMHSQSAHGKEITGVTHCRKTGDGKQYFGYYYAN